LEFAANTTPPGIALMPERRAMIVSGPGVLVKWGRLGRNIGVQTRFGKSPLWVESGRYLFVMLNSFQHPSRLTDYSLQVEKWTLKQVQGDGAGMSALGR